MTENQNQNHEGTEQQEPVSHNVTIETTKGRIVLEVYPELMPITVANFDKLVQLKCCLLASRGKSTQQKCRCRSLMTLILLLPSRI